MTATPFEDVRASAENTKNVRKTLGAVVFYAEETADAIDTLTDTDGNIIELPAEYKALGLLTEDGITFDQEIDSEEVRALGHVSAVRRDITGATRTVGFTAMEFGKAAVRTLAHAMDLSETTADTNGELSYDVPDVPENRHYRLLVVGRDGSLESEILRAKFYPRVSVTSLPSEAWNSADPITAEFTFTAYRDEELGFVTREFLGGRGFDAAELGYGVTGA